MINLRLLLDHRPTRPALSMVEVMISTVIVGVLIAAALNTVGASKRGQLSNANHRIGQLLAQELMSEILPQMYEEPDMTPLFGPEAPEGKEANWVETVPGKGWFVILRLYGPTEAWFDRTWKPGDVEMIKS